MKQTIGKLIFEKSHKNDVHNNYETDYRLKVVTAGVSMFILAINVIFSLKELNCEQKSQYFHKYQYIHKCLF